MPPKKNKHAPRNAFYFFMMDFKDRQGAKYNSLKDVADAAGPHWTRMSKDQKKIYEDKASFERNYVRQVKFATDGRDIAQIEKMEKDQLARVQMMKDDINREIKSSSNMGKIEDKLFFIIHFNTFCYYEMQNKYFPAEIAISRFSLKDGVLPDFVFHSMIRPGVLPLGFASTANLHSKETHQIPPPMADDYENDTQKVFEEMKTFLLNQMEGSKRMPVLYTNEKELNMVQTILDDWCEQFDDRTSNFEVYNLQYMFRILRNTTAGFNIWPSDTYGAREIEKDVNAYAMGISCHFHEMTNIPLFCSRSVVIRYAFTICDNCCPDLNIPLIVGQHVPNIEFIPAKPGSRPGSSASSRSKRSTASDDDSSSIASFSSQYDYDTLSETSDSTDVTVMDDENFPSLGRGRKHGSSNVSQASWKQFTPSDSSSIYSQPKVQSYAGATGTSGFSLRPADMPSSVRNNMERLSLNPSQSASEVSSYSGRGESFSDSNDNFPVLGRRRGSRRNN